MVADHSEKAILLAPDDTDVIMEFKSRLNNKHELRLSTLCALVFGFKSCTLVKADS